MNLQGEFASAQTEPEKVIYIYSGAPTDSDIDAMEALLSEKERAKLSELARNFAFVNRGSYSDHCIIMRCFKAGFLTSKAKNAYES